MLQLCGLAVVMVCAMSLCRDGGKAEMKEEGRRKANELASDRLRMMRRLAQTDVVARDNSAAKVKGSTVVFTVCSSPTKKAVP
jgi:hypothetical protein